MLAKVKIPYVGEQNLKRLNSHQVELPPQSASSTLALAFVAG
jgi:hypothetical protein